MGGIGDFAEAFGRSNAFPEATGRLLDRQMQLGQLQQQKQQQDLENLRVQNRDKMSQAKFVMELAGNEAFAPQSRLKAWNTGATLINELLPGTDLRTDHTELPNNAKEISTQVLAVNKVIEKMKKENTPNEKIAATVLPLLNDILIANPNLKAGQREAIANQIGSVQAPVETEQKRLQKVEDTIMQANKEVDVARRKRELEGENGKITNPDNLVVFEARSGFTAKDRGTPEYGTAFDAWIKDRLGRDNVLGRDPDTGNIVVYNNKKKEVSEISPTGDIVDVQKKSLTYEAVKDFSVFDNLIGGIKHIREVAEANPQYLGPIQGRWNKLRTQFYEDPDFTTLDREVESLITMAYSLSGKQISVQEIEMLKRAILPSVTQPDGNFFAALDHAENWLIRSHESKVKKLKESQYQVGPSFDSPEPTKSKDTKTPNNEPKKAMPEPTRNIVERYDELIKDHTETETLQILKDEGYRDIYGN